MLARQPVNGVAAKGVVPNIRGGGAQVAVVMV